MPSLAAKLPPQAPETAAKNAQNSQHLHKRQTNSITHPIKPGQNFAKPPLSTVHPLSNPTPTPASFLTIPPDFYNPAARVTPTTLSSCRQAACRTDMGGHGAPSHVSSNSAALNRHVDKSVNNDGVDEQPQNRVMLPTIFTATEEMPPPDLKVCKMGSGINSQCKNGLLDEKQSIKNDFGIFQTIEQNTEITGMLSNQFINPFLHPQIGVQHSDNQKLFNSLDTNGLENKEQQQLANGFNPSLKIQSNFKM